MLYQLMYSSQATDPMTAESLEKILTDARIGNSKNNITGALVYVDGVFFQILEGEKDLVSNLIANISKDARHQLVKVFYESGVDARAFSDWSMGYVSPTAEQMAIWAGLPGTATIGSMLAEVNRKPERVPRILVSVLNALAEE